MKSTGLIPSDPVLTKESLLLQEEEGEVRARGDETEGHETVHRNDVGQIVVYTDGGCTNPA